MDSQEAVKKIVVKRKYIHHQIIKREEEIEWKSVVYLGKKSANKSIKDLKCNDEFIKSF